MITTTKNIAGSFQYETTTKINDTKQLVTRTKRIFSKLVTVAFLKQDGQMIFLRELSSVKPTNFKKETIEAHHQSININEIILTIPV